MAQITASFEQKCDSAEMEKKVCHPAGGRGEVVYDGVRLEELIPLVTGPLKRIQRNYELLLRGMRACGESASMPRTRNLELFRKPPRIC
ncbi:unnamed protein product [Strongylus vulgaris]|uniref:Uncharacterized protein n=1 Tax=Strongylus vulgaris TaxID=40348 RepID=A0A3P7LD54_STRVU|nr:unnamed protein product [Strongylus vulgaris]